MALSVAGGGEQRWWSADTGECVGRGAPVSEDDRDKFSSVLGHDGHSAILANWSCGVYVCESSGGHRTREIGVRSGFGAEVMLTKSGELVVRGVGKHDHDIEVWDMKALSREAILRAHRGTVRGLALLPDGHTFVSTAEDLTLRVWDLSERTREGVITTNSLMGEPTVAPDGRLVLVTDSRKNACLYDLHRRECILELPGSHLGFGNAQFTPDGQHIAEISYGTAGRALFLWDLRSGTRSLLKESGSYRISRFSISPDSRFGAVGFSDGRVEVWDMALGSRVLGSNMGDGVSSLSGILPDGLFGAGTATGNVHFLRLVGVPLSPPIVTMLRGMSQHDPKSSEEYGQCAAALCPWCGSTFHPEDAPLRHVERNDRDYELAVSGNSYLVLPPVAWDAPELASSCGECGKAIRFNPFFADTQFVHRGLRRTALRERAAGRHTARRPSSLRDHCPADDSHAQGWKLMTAEGGRVCGECVLGWIGDAALVRSPESEQKVVCSLCGRPMKCTYFSTPVGAVCTDCATSVLETSASSADADDVIQEDPVGLLSCFSRLDQRFTALWRFADIKRAQQEVISDELADSVIALLGYPGKTPLAPHIRKLALSACTSMAPMIVDNLHCALQPTPWRFYVNVLRVLATVIPEDNRFKTEVTKAAKDKRTSVRLSVPVIVGEHDRKWTRDLLEGLTEDAGADIRQKAVSAIDEWDIRTGSMRRVEIEMREMLDDLFCSSDSALRRTGVEQLFWREGSWASRYARKLADDPDPSVREAVCRLYERWKERDRD